jgi:hypothetical protein
MIRTAHRMPPKPTAIELVPGEYDCLSFWEPWAWAMFDAGKRIENRTRPTHKRGIILVQTAQHFDIGVWRMLEHRFLTTTTRIPPINSFVLGHVIGAIQVADCVYSANGNGIWGMPNRFHWHIDAVLRFKTPFRMKGKQGFWKVTLDAADLKAIL